MFQSSGVVVLIDQAGLTLSHVMQFTPGFARAVVAWVQVRLYFIYPKVNLN